MTWEEQVAKLKVEAEKHASALIGRKVVKVEMPVGYPGHFSSVTLVFDDGTKLEVAPGGWGCSECDPDGIGWGVEVEMRKP
jgi:hypothetical protein